MKLLKLAPLALLVLAQSALAGPQDLQPGTEIKASTKVKNLPIYEVTKASLSDVTVEDDGPKQHYVEAKLRLDLVVEGNIRGQKPSDVGYVLASDATYKVQSLSLVVPTSDGIWFDYGVNVPVVIELPIAGYVKESANGSAVKMKTISVGSAVLTVWLNNDQTLRVEKQ